MNIGVILFRYVAPPTPKALLQFPARYSFCTQLSSHLQATNSRLYHSSQSHTRYCAVGKFLYVRTFIAKLEFTYKFIIQPFKMVEKLNNIKQVGAETKGRLSCTIKVPTKVGELLQEPNDSHLPKALLQYAASQVPKQQRGARQSTLTHDLNGFIQERQQFAVEAITVSKLRRYQTNADHSTTQNNALEKAVADIVIAKVKFSRCPNLFKFTVTCTVYVTIEVCAALCVLHTSCSSSCVSNLKSLFSLFKPFQFTCHFSWHWLSLRSPKLSQHTHNLQILYPHINTNEIKTLVTDSVPSEANMC